MNTIENNNDRDLEDVLILCGCVATFLFIFPFAIYRLLQGDLHLGLIDSIVSLVLVVVFLHAWRAKKIKYFNVCVLAVVMCASLGAIYLNSSDMIFWTFPVIAATYFLLSSQVALLANGLFVIIVIAITMLSKELSMSVMGMYPSLLLVSLFGFVFSIRSEQNTNSLNALVSEDVLTNIKNRRSFDIKIDELLKEDKRTEKPVSLLLLDLDEFKMINDIHGHEQGDRVLYDFAQTVKAVIRDTDYVYRFGGDEFTVIANNTSLENAGKFADIIRETIHNKPCLSAFNLTVSIGVSEISRRDSADCWFRRTDLALYQAKAQGRNRVWLAELDKKGEIHFRPTRSKYNFKAYASPKKIENVSTELDGSYKCSANSQLPKVHEQSYPKLSVSNF